MGIAQDGKKVQVLSSYGLLNTKYAECKQQNVELVQIRDLLRRKLEGIKEKKKGLLEIAQNGNERTALSSYAVLQTKYAVSSKEKVELVQMIGELRGELEDLNRNEEEDINYNKEEDHKSLIQTVVNVRCLTKASGKRHKKEWQNKIRQKENKPEKKTRADKTRQNKTDQDTFERQM